MPALGIWQKYPAFFKARFLVFDCGGNMNILKTRIDSLTQGQVFVLLLSSVYLLALLMWATIIILLTRFGLI